MVQEKEAKYLCSQCNSLFTRQYSLKVHQQAIHEGVRYPCNGCDLKLSSRRNLERHKILVCNKPRHKKKDVVHLCELCDSQFIHKISLRKH